MTNPTHQAEAVVSQNGTIVIEYSPFQPGEKVEVTIVTQTTSEQQCYPLRGTLVKYEDPFGSVAEDDWEVLQ